MASLMGEFSKDALKFDLKHRTAMYLLWGCNFLFWLLCIGKGLGGVLVTFLGVYSVLYLAVHFLLKK